MSIGSKETEVYVKIKKPNSTRVERFKVTAGGGGWEPRLTLLLYHQKQSL